MERNEFLKNVKECVANNWQNSDLWKETEEILSFIVNYDYKGRNEEIEDIIEDSKVKTFFDIQDKIASNIKEWDFYYAMKINKINNRYWEESKNDSEMREDGFREWLKYDDESRKLIDEYIETLWTEKTKDEALDEFIEIYSRIKEI